MRKDTSNGYSFLLRCTREEGEAMRRAAKGERRSLNSFILQAAMSRLELNRRIDERLGRLDNARKLRLANDAGRP